jgi:hypothetical protein
LLADPGRLIGFERGNDRVLSITNLARVRSGVVTTVEDRLEVERDRRIARQKRNVDRRQMFREADRVNEKRLRDIGATNRDV